MLKQWKTRVPAALAIALAVGACSLDEIAGDAIDIGVDDGASKGVKDSVQVNGNQEQTLTLETGATLTLPKGAVDHDVTIGVERPSDAKAIEFVETLKSIKAVASAPYVLTPHGTEFAKDVKLEIPVVNNKGKDLVAAYLKDESDREWKFLDTPVVENDVATVTLKHFSVIVLLDRARAGIEIDEPEDAGSTRDAGVAEPDAGSDDDAGHKADDDAGRDEAKDAGSPIGASDAGTSTMLDASAQVTPDAGQVQPPVTDASVSFDAAQPPVNEDAGSGGGAVDSGTQQPPDAMTQVEDSGAGQSDSGTVVIITDDAGEDSGYPCEPLLYCQPYQCGSVPNGCGGEIGCGNCEEYGYGECGRDEPNVCPPPID